jgi:tRNA (guanine26-N2/guanine27-N2)-dimethyltransferase
MTVIGRFGSRLSKGYVNFFPRIRPPARKVFTSANMTSNSLDIAATPTLDQHIQHNGVEYTTVKEGLAYILIPNTASKTPQTTPRGENQAQSVFYNPIQQFNRDLSVLAIKAYGEDALERKRRDLTRNKEKFRSKNKEKKLKRKREDGVGEDSRKTGKLNEGNGPLNSITRTTGQRDDGSTQEIGNVEQQAAEVDVNALAKVLETPEAENLQMEKTEARILALSEPNDTNPPDVTREGNEGKESTETASYLNGDQDPKPVAKPIEPTFTILDALSATGLRALRYAKEIPFTTSITANDLLPAATKMIDTNVKYNKLEDKIKSVTGNALTHMYSLAGDNCENERGKKVRSEKYDVIDLDPYGTAAPFLDAAVQSVREDGGLLCVTCTDAGVWASNGYPEKSYSLYGGIPIKGMHSHEGGLRLILNAIATSAARYGLAMEPLLSLSIDFYARVFVRIHKSAADVKFLAGKTMVVHNCDTGCGAWETQMVARNKLAKNKSGTGHFWKHVFAASPTTSENCIHCGSVMHLAGPMYAGPLHSPEFIQRILDGLPTVSKDTYHTTERIEGMLNVALEETLMPVDDELDSPTSTSKTKRYDPAALDLYPFFFIPSVLAKVIHCITPHENALRGALRHLGYRVTRSHTKPGSIRTDAPWDVIWEMMREWAKQKAPIKEGAIRKGTAGWEIMRMEEKKVKDGTANTEDKKKEKPKLEIVFNEALGKERDQKKLVRYQVNPRENWGPMNRAKGNT